ncbi:host specificity protein J, partial [Escherichia coli PA28]|jgi:hypothetical protein
MGKG